jgi:hypothetical protein
MLHRISPPLPASLTPQGGGKHARYIDWIYILYSLWVGILLLFLPWLNIWDNNYLLHLYPQIRPVVTNPFFKGFVLGLGIVNILIGINDVQNIARRKWISR